MNEFTNFKNKHINQTVLLFAPGSSLNKFNDNFNNNIIRCGINGVIAHNNIVQKLNYYIWGGDLDIPVNPSPLYNIVINKLNNLNNKTIKMVNCWTDNNIIHPTLKKKTQIDPELAKSLGFIRYNQIYYRPKFKYYKDFSLYKSGVDGYSTGFHAMQILLYMGFTKFILVGFDCGGNHSYKKFQEYKDDLCGWGKEINLKLVNQWKIFKEWIKKNYNNIDIKVINPLGLINIFEEYKNY